MTRTKIGYSNWPKKGYITCRQCGKDEWVGFYGVHYGDGAGPLPVQVTSGLCLKCYYKDRDKERAGRLAQRIVQTK